MQAQASGMRSDWHFSRGQNQHNFCALNAPRAPEVNVAATAAAASATAAAAAAAAAAASAAAAARAVARSREREERHDHLRYSRPEMILLVNSHAGHLWSQLRKPAAASLWLSNVSWEPRQEFSECLIARAMKKDQSRRKEKNVSAPHTARPGRRVPPSCS